MLGAGAGDEADHVQVGVLQHVHDAVLPVDLADEGVDVAGWVVDVFAIGPADAVEVADAPRVLAEDDLDGVELALGVDDAFVVGILRLEEAAVGRRAEDHILNAPHAVVVEVLGLDVGRALADGGLLADEAAESVIGVAGDNVGDAISRRWPSLARRSRQSRLMSPKKSGGPPLDIRRKNAQYFNAHINNSSFKASHVLILKLFVFRRVSQ